MPTIQNRRATAAQWTAANPVLAAGEIGFELDTNALKVGDGLTPWGTLPYLSDESLKTLVESGRLSESTLDATYARVGNAEAAAIQMVPATFTKPIGYNNPLIDNAWRDSSGVFHADMPDLDSFHNGGAGSVYYVDPVNGQDNVSDGRDGKTWGLAYKTPAYASAKAGADLSELVIGGGLYTRAQYAQKLRVPRVKLTARPGERVVFMCGETLPVWTPVSGGCYSAPLASCNGVLDMRGRDLASGADPDHLSPVGSTEEVQEKPGSWFLSGGTLYVHRANGSAPDDDVLCSRPISTLYYSAADFYDPADATPPSFFSDGVEMWGGTGTNMTCPDGLEAGSRVIGRNARYAYAGSANGLSVWGMEYALHVDSKADHNQLDGFNYHERNGMHPAVVEIRCEGSYNGVEAGSQNGSTIHESCVIARIGGAYVGNLGANLADVGEAVTWIVGSKVGGYRNDGLDNGEDILVGDGWIDQVVSTSPKSVRVSGSTSDPVARVRDSILLGTSVSVPY